MKRLFIGIAVLSLLLALGLFLSFATEKIYAPIAAKLDNAAERALAGDTEGSKAQAMSAREKWQRWKNTTATVADHTPMEEIDHLFREMEIYAATGEIPHFAACCVNLAAMIRDMGEAHHMNLWNLL